MRLITGAMLGGVLAWVALVAMGCFYGVEVQALPPRAACRKAAMADATWLFAALGAGTTFIALMISAMFRAILAQLGRDYESVDAVYRLVESSDLSVIESSKKVDPSPAPEERETSRSRKEVLRIIQANFEPHILQAIKDQRDIRFIYKKTGKAREERRIRPEKIIDVPHEHYPAQATRCVRGYCYLRQAQRSFAIKKIVSMAVTK